MDFRKALLKRLPDALLYKAMRRFERPWMPPAQVALALTDAEGRNGAASLKREKHPPALGWEELCRTFQSLPIPPFQVDVTGGDPFLREDAEDALFAVCEHGRPDALRILVEGARPGEAAGTVGKLAERFERIVFLVMVRFDDIGGPEAGKFEAALEGYRNMKRIGRPNVFAGVQALASKDTVDRMASIVEYARLLYPDAIGVEIAHGAEALGLRPEASPPLDKLERLAFRVPAEERDGAPGALRFFRELESARFRLAAENLRAMKQSVPCRAGSASVFIHADGLVTDCPVAGRQMGRLEEFDYDLARLLQTRQAVQTRREVRESGCFCPMTHCATVNLLVDKPLGGELSRAAF